MNDKTETRIENLEKRVSELEKKMSKDKIKNPKRSSPPSPYALFVQKTIPELIKKFPELTPNERMKKCGELWRIQKESTEN